MKHLSLHKGELFNDTFMFVLSMWLPAIAAAALRTPDRRMKSIQRAKNRIAAFWNSL